MANKSIQIRDTSLRDLRVVNNLTQLETARKAKLSENSVANAENGRPVSKRTVLEIIKALDDDAEMLCVDVDRRLYIIKKIAHPPTGHEVIKFISEELNGATSVEGFLDRLEILLKLAGVKEAFLSRLFEASLHWSMSFPSEAADKIRSMFDANEDGELIVDAPALERAIARMDQIEVEPKAVKDNICAAPRGFEIAWTEYIPIRTLTLATVCTLLLTFCFVQFNKHKQPRLKTKSFPTAPVNYEFDPVDSVFDRFGVPLRTENEELTASLRAAIETTRVGQKEIEDLKLKLRAAQSILDASLEASPKNSNIESKREQAQLHVAQNELTKTIARIDSVLREYTRAEAFDMKRFEPKP